MERVEGLGGAFFRARRDPVALARWYDEHLGVTSGLEGDLVWQQQPGPMIWAPFPADTDKLPPDQAVMFNFRVRDLTAMVDQLRAAGVDVDAEIESQEGVGRFTWLRDPEGHVVELWQPQE